MQHLRLNPGLISQSSRVGLLSSLEPLARVISEDGLRVGRIVRGLNEKGEASVSGCDGVRATPAHVI